MTTTEPIQLDGTYQEMQEVQIRREALQAIALMKEKQCSPLSILARIQKLPHTDVEAFKATMKQNKAFWKWALPVVMNTKKTIGLLFGDADTSVVGQYAWADEQGLFPGLQINVSDEAVQLNGIITPTDVQLQLMDFLNIASVAETETTRFTLSVDAFWAILALLDGYRMLQLRHRMARTNTLPSGISASVLQEAWVMGQKIPHLGWAVSLFGAIIPEAVPNHFEQKIPHILTQMEANGILLNLEENPSKEALYVFEEGLDAFLDSILPNAIQFGLVVQTLPQKERVEVLALGGWRTAFGFWLADVSQLETGFIELLHVGPSFMTDLIEAWIHGDPLFTTVSSETPQTIEPEHFEAQLPELTVCPSCQATFPPHANFCPVCGTARPESKPQAPPSKPPLSCPNCNQPLREGAHFCTHCGHLLK